jgi:hypothetical protein
MKFQATRVELFAWGHLRTHRPPRRKSKGPWVKAEDAKPIIQFLVDRFGIGEVARESGLSARAIYRMLNENQWISFWSFDKIITRAGTGYEDTEIAIYEQRDLGKKIDF